MIQPLAVATHDVSRPEVKSGDSVRVLGGGPIGVLIAMVSRHGGARVIVSEVNRYRIVTTLYPLGPPSASPRQPMSQCKT